MQSINPVTNEVISTYRPHNIADACEAIEQSHAAFLHWKNNSFEHRAEVLMRVAKVLKHNKERYAKLITAEMGKAIKEARSEVEKCALVCEYYAKHAAEFLQDKRIETEYSQSFVTYQPIGVVLAIMPWNFPFWQVFRFAAPTLMAGNGAVLKHASNVSGCALAIEEIFVDAGLEPNLFKTLLVPGKEAEALIENPLVQAVTLTGSTQAGKKVAAKAGECIKKTVLELGGSDAYVVLEDADLDLAVEACVTSRLLNAGQSCIAAKRFVVVADIYDQFVEKYVSAMKAKRMGDPMDESTDYGPQASKELRDQLHEQVKSSVQKGAIALLGGEVPQTEGAFYPATVLCNVKPGMPAYDEELFGPVASIIKVKNGSEAMQVANDSVFGLGGGIFTQNIERGTYLAREVMQSGACFVNDFTKSDPRLPFGGIKQSGYGRELAQHGIYEFVNIKTVVVK